MTKSNRKRLEERLQANMNCITPIKLAKDKESVYLHYCAYFRHSGVIGNKKAEICQERECNHYFKFRPEENMK